MHKAAQTVKLTEIVNQIMGDAIDSVIMPAALQGRGSVATDLVIVSNCLSSEPRKYVLVSSIHVLSSVSIARRTTGESFVSNCKAIQHLASTRELRQSGVQKHSIF